MPNQKPVTAGTKDHVPILLSCSMAGIRRLQMDAATITPAANPVSALCTFLLKSFLMKNTHAAPADVPMNGIRSPVMTCPSNMVLFLSSLFLRNHCKPWMRCMMIAADFRETCYYQSFFNLLLGISLHPIDDFFKLFRC